MRFLQIKESQIVVILQHGIATLPLKTLLITSNELMVFIYFHKEETHAWKEGIGKSLLVSSISKAEKKIHFESSF
jgi:hypothetical protein